MTFKNIVLVLLISLFSSSALIAVSSLPVDEEISILRQKADHLEKLKELFLANKCSVTVGTNQVGLVAGALRSEGLVMAIGERFPGNYLGFHKAPKPEQLSRVIDGSFMKAGMGQGAVIVTARLGFDSALKPVALLAAIAVPTFVEGTEDLWIYEKTPLNVKLSHLSKAKIEAKLKGGKSVSLQCE